MAQYSTGVIIALLIVCYLQKVGAENATTGIPAPIHGGWSLIINGFEFQLPQDFQVVDIIPHPVPPNLYVIASPQEIISIYENVSTKEIGCHEVIRLPRHQSLITNLSCSSGQVYNIHASEWTIIDIEPAQIIQSHYFKFYILLEDGHMIAFVLHSTSDEWYATVLVGEANSMTFVEKIGKNFGVFFTNVNIHAEHAMYRNVDFNITMLSTSILISFVLQGSQSENDYPLMFKGVYCYDCEQQYMVMVASEYFVNLLNSRSSNRTGCRSLNVQFNFKTYEYSFTPQQYVSPDNCALFHYFHIGHNLFFNNNGGIFGASNDKTFPVSILSKQFDKVSNKKFRNVSFQVNSDDAILVSKTNRLYRVSSKFDRTTVAKTRQRQTKKHQYSFRLFSKHECCQDGNDIINIYGSVTFERCILACIKSPKCISFGYSDHSRICTIYSNLEPVNLAESSSKEYPCYIFHTRK